MIRWKFWATTNNGNHGNKSNEATSDDPSRARFLRSAATGLTGAVTGAVVAAIGGSSVVKAADGDPVALGASSNGGGTPNLAENATEVQYDGVGPPLGVVFLAQADNKWMPAQTGFPAALAGWTSTNPDIATGVYGYSEHPIGMGVVGWAVNGVGGSFIGPNRAPLNLHPEPRPMPPPTGQAGDLYVTVNVDNLATLWFHTGVLGWKHVSVF